VLKSIHSLKELIYPNICLCCGKTGVKICHNCSKYWLANPNKSKVENNCLFFVTTYDETTSPIILAAKESGNREAVKLIARSITNSISFAILNLGIAQPINLVTIPSQLSAIRRRGRDHIKDLVQEVITQLNKQNIDAVYLPILKPIKKIKDQSDLNGLQRKENMSHAFIVKTSPISQSAVIVIDDLVTTGASILEGVRALSEAKITVDAVVTACAVGRNSLIR
jgi:predicted amidophosphoribosyltransferase